MRKIIVFDNLGLRCVPGCGLNGNTHIKAISEKGQKGDIVLSLCKTHRTELLATLLTQYPFEMLLESLASVPRTWLPQLIKALVTVGYTKGVFEKGMSSEFVTEIERQLEDA